MKNDHLEDLTSRLVWHEVLASVMRRYGGQTLLDELVVPMPTGPSGQTDPDLGFMGRMPAVCSLPRTSPGRRYRYGRP